MAGGYHLKKKKKNFSTNLIEVQVSLKKTNKQRKKEKEKNERFSLCYLLITCLILTLQRDEPMSTRSISTHLSVDDRG